MRKYWMVLALGLAALPFTTGCDGEGDGTGGTGGHAGHGGEGGHGGGGAGGDTGGAGGTGGGGTQSVSIAFAGMVGAEAFDCTKTYTGLGTTAAEAKITDFRLYVHDVALVDKGGATVPVTLDQDGIWQHENVALLDFESGTGACANGTAELNTALKGTVPAGSYTGITFKMGVPFALNHADVATAPSPLNLSALFWSWNGGYKFLRVDALATGAPMSFNLHLGSTECQDDGSGGVSACNKPNRPEIMLMGADPLAAKVIVDYAAVVAGNDITKDDGGAPGCMSGAADPECAPVFDRLGLDIQTGMPKEGEALFYFE